VTVKQITPGLLTTVLIVDMVFNLIRLCFPISTRGSAACHHLTAAYWRHNSSNTMGDWEAV
jgi:hypothetical protein